jgi:hypothetical protein
MKGLELRGIRVWARARVCGKDGKQLGRRADGFGNSKGSTPKGKRNMPDGSIVLAICQLLMFITGMSFERLGADSNRYGEVC